MHALELPTEDTARAAGDAVRAFTSTPHRPPPTHIVVLADGDRPTRVELPVEALDLFLEVLTHLSNGHGVTIMPVKAELTTQQAADLLNVSRPYLIKLLDEGHLPFRRVGTHRRVRLDDLLAYKRIDEARRRDAADALAAEAQALGLGY